MGFTVTVVRHGETDFNGKLLIHTHSDGTLNANGVRQAEELGASLKNETFTRVYSSDSQRCQDTTHHALAQLTSVPEVVLDRRLRERSYGEWDGQPMDRVVKLAKERKVDPLELTAPGGETFEESFKRLVSFFEELFELVDTTETEENVLIVSHGMSIQYLLIYLNKRKDLFELSNFKFDPWHVSGNTAVTKFKVSKKGEDEKRKIDIIWLHDSKHLTTRADQHHVAISQKIKENSDAKMFE